MITITEQVAVKVKNLIEKENNVEGLRIQVMPGGCAGYTYNFLFDKKRDGDIIVEVKGLNFFIDEDSYSFLDGCKVDYIDTLKESGFKVENPNAKSSCGCGHSFS